MPKTVDFEDHSAAATFGCVYLQPLVVFYRASRITFWKHTLWLSKLPECHDPKSTEPCVISNLKISTCILASPSFNNCVVLGYLSLTIKQIHKWSQISVRMFYHLQCVFRPRHIKPRVLDFRHTAPCLFYSTLDLLYAGLPVLSLLLHHLESH